MADITKINLKGTVLDIKDAGAARSSDLAAKQDALVSGTNIKTVNSTSLLGSGNISIPAGQDGVSPHIDTETGNWFVGNTNTGVHAQGPTGNVTVSDGVAQISIINDLTTGGVGKALSAEMGLLLKSNVIAVQANIQRLYNKLANMAFWDSQDQEDAEPAPLDWSVPKVAVTITNNIGAGAVIKRNGTAVSGTLQIDQGDPLTLTIESADEDHALNNVTATVGGTAATLLESGGVYTLSIAHVNNSTAIVVSGSAVFSWPTAPKTNEVDGGGNIIRYGMQQGRSVYAGYGTITTGLISNNTVPAVILSPAGLPLDEFVFTSANVMGGHSNTNPGRTANCFFATGGKRYLNVRLVDGGGTTGYEYKVAVACYGDAVIGNAQADHFYSAKTTIDGQKGRINYALPSAINQDGSMTWKIDLQAQEAGITYIKLLVRKYPQGDSTGVDSRTWFNDMTLNYKFTDD